MRSVIYALSLVFSFFGLVSKASEIEVAVLPNATERAAMEHVFARFAKESGIGVKLRPRTDAAYERDVDQWLTTGSDVPDILFWHASQNLFYYTKQGGVLPLTAWWKHAKLDKNFARVKHGVSDGGEVYALPISYYPWGFFYKKSLVDKFGGVPNSWDAFLLQCRKLKAAGITPIGLGALNAWPVAAWFDYLDLRLNGLVFHEQLLSGKIPFSDRRVARVFFEWKKLVDLKAYNSDFARIDWDAVLPNMYRDNVAYTLIGGFANSRLPDQLVNDIGMMPFPSLGSVGDYEEAPLVVLLIPRHAKHIAEAKKLLEFMARADVQNEFNNGFGFLPANKMSAVGNNVFSRYGRDILNRAQGVSQYFDRDSTPEFAKKSLPVLVHFVENGNIDEAIAGMERARVEVFK